MMKTLVACPLPEFALDELRALGLNVDLQPDLTADELPAALAETTLLIVSRMRVSPEAIAAAPSLQMIICWGRDTSNVAIAEASAAGVFVSRCSDTDAAAVAELTFALFVALDRDLLAHADDLRAGRFQLDPEVTAAGLAGHALGLVGFGEIGREVARRARSFGMRPFVWAPDLPPDLAHAHGAQYCGWPRDLARQSDLLFVHAPEGTAPPARVDHELLEGLEEGASLVFIGDPAALDERALSTAIRDRKLRVALDIHPAAEGHDTVRFKAGLLDLPGVIGAYRLANQTVQAQHASARRILEIVRRFLIGGEVLGCVNLLERSPATWLLVLRLKDAVGVMADIMNAVRDDGINAEEINSRVFQGARAAWCTIALDERPGRETIEAIRALDGVLHLEVRAVV